MTEILNLITKHQSTINALVYNAHYTYLVTAILWLLASLLEGEKVIARYNGRENYSQLKVVISEQDGYKTTYEKACKNPAGNSRRQTVIYCCSYCWYALYRANVSSHHPFYDFPAVSGSNKHAGLYGLHRNLAIFRCLNCGCALACHLQSIKLAGRWLRRRPHTLPYWRSRHSQWKDTWLFVTQSRHV